MGVEVVPIRDFQAWFMNLYAALSNEEHAIEYADKLLMWNSNMLIKFIDADYIKITYRFLEGSGTHLEGHLPNFPSLKLNITLDESDGYDKDFFIMSGFTLIPNTFTPLDVKEYIKSQCFFHSDEQFDIDDFLSRRTLVLVIHNGVRHYDFENILFSKKPPEDYDAVLKQASETKYRNSLIDRHCKEVKSLLNEVLNECGEN